MEGFTRRIFWCRNLLNKSTGEVEGTENDWIGSYETNNVSVDWVTVPEGRDQRRVFASSVRLLISSDSVNWLVLGFLVSTVFHYQIWRFFTDITESCHWILCWDFLVQFSSRFSDIFLTINSHPRLDPRTVSVHVVSRPKCRMHLSFITHVFHVLYIAASVSHDNDTIKIRFALVIKL
jgi:hypothetical protein